VLDKKKTNRHCTGGNLPAFCTHLDRAGASDRARPARRRTASARASPSVGAWRCSCRLPPPTATSVSSALVCLQAGVGARPKPGRNPKLAALDERPIACMTPSRNAKMSEHILDVKTRDPIGTTVRSRARTSGGDDISDHVVSSNYGAFVERRNARPGTCRTAPTWIRAYLGTKRAAP